MLRLDGRAVQPNVFHGALERLAVTGWQVVEEGGRLRVLLAQPGTQVDLPIVRDAVLAALARVGVHDVAIEVAAVDAIPRTALGKAPLIRRASSESAVTPSTGPSRDSRDGRDLTSSATIPPRSIQKTR